MRITDNLSVFPLQKFNIIKVIILFQYFYCTFLIYKNCTIPIKYITPKTTFDINCTFHSLAYQNEMNIYF